MSSVHADRSTLDAAWQAAWSDFLSNRIEIAERRAAPLVSQFLEPAIRAAAASSSSDDEELADRLVTLADLAHIAGAARGDTQLLTQAIGAYDAHLERRPDNHSAMRMRAETLLRCRRTADGFAAFRALFHATLAPSAEIAPFQLMHDAECIEDAVRLGADAASLSTAAAWRQLALELQQQAGDDGAKTRRHKVASLSDAQRALLGSHGTAPLPLPPSVDLQPPSGQEQQQQQRALRSDIDWPSMVHEYNRSRCIVIDNILDPAALSILQAYSRHGANFRTLRKGYLGAFPSDGTTHPLLLSLAEELTAAAPSIFGEHPLALWWIFKYDSEVNPSGIGIHADPAAVNINLWLTDDAACLDGGGLAIYSHVPPLEQQTQEVNHEFESAKVEGTLRESLIAKGSVRTVPYRCNRAAIFVSDQYHESLPFKFAPGYEMRRANLTLLFGDRWRLMEKKADDGDAFDVFGF